MNLEWNHGDRNKPDLLLGCVTGLRVPHRTSYQQRHLSSLAKQEVCASLGFLLGIQQYYIERIIVS